MNIGFYNDYCFLLFPDVTAAANVSANITMKAAAHKGQTAGVIVDCGHQFPA